MCSSLSVAITPPVRSREFPEGLPNVRDSMKQKIIDGNSFGFWVASLVTTYVDESTHFWVENPDSSFLWQLPPWRALLSSSFVTLFRTDFCRFGTPWRKRTKFATDIVCLADIKLLCTLDYSHTALRGCGPKGLPWTKIAEPYPHGLADLLAASVCFQCGWHSHPPVPQQFAARALAYARRVPCAGC